MREKSRLFEKYAFAWFKNRKLLAWDERGIAIPLMDQNERTAGTGIFWPSQSQVFFSSQLTSHFSIMSWIRHMIYFVGNRKKWTEADWLKGTNRHSYFWWLNHPSLLDLRRKFEMLSSRLCMDFVWTPRLLLLPYLHPWTTGQLLKPNVCEGCACQSLQCVFLHMSVP